MNHLVKLCTFFIALSLLSTLACSKDNPGPGGCAANFNYAVELQDESSALSAAASAYGNDPSTANCNAFKAAYQDYLDAAEDIRPCVLQADLSAYQAAIDDARDDLDDLTC